MGPLQFRPLNPSEMFEPNMAKIVGPMIILIEGEKSPNFAEGNMHDSVRGLGSAKSPFSKCGTKVNLALTSQKLYLLNDLQEMQAEFVMDISFATFTETIPSMAAAFCKSKGGIVPDISKKEEIKDAEENQRRHGHRIPQFTLSRDKYVIEFAPLDESEFF